MKRYAISGLALTVAVLGGCSTAPTRVGLDPEVEYVAPAARVVYAPPTTAITTAPATTTVIAPAATAVVQTPGSVAAANPAIVAAPDRNNHQSRPGHHRGRRARHDRDSAPAPPSFLRRGQWSFPHRARRPSYLPRARS